MRSSWTALKHLAVTQPTKAPLYFGADRDRLRAAGRLNARHLDHLRPLIVPGVTTAELDRVAYEFTRAHGHTPACLGYEGPANAPYAHTICTSINDVVCHGVPDETILREGDIINVDVTTIVDGFHGDSSETFLIGECGKEARALVEATLEALYIGIQAVRPYTTVYEIGRAITAFARGRGYGVVREYQGHGIGRKFHTEPGIPHYPFRAGMSQILVPGMCFTIEPMLNTGHWRTRKDEHGGWPVRTADGGLSAQFEHTILLTEEGPEILTQTEAGPKPNFPSAPSSATHEPLDSK